MIFFNYFFLFFLKFIYKFRVDHQRTMLIRSNLSKMSNLNFNSKFEFKSMGLYHTHTVTQNAKKGKKGKKKK